MADLEFEIVTKADSRGLHETADDMDRTGKSSDHMSSGFKAAAKDSRTLDQEIKDLRTHIRELGQQYDDTADKSIFKDIGKDRSAIRRIEQIKKDIEQAAEGDGTFLGGASLNTDLLGSLKGALIPSLIGLGVIVSPALGAIVAGAVGSIGVVGGIAGGVFAASHDPTVKAAFQDFGHTISQEFFGSGNAFVAPIVNSLGILKDDFAKLDLKGTFALAAPAVELLAKGLGGLVDNVMPGFRDLLRQSVPIATALEHGLEGTGTAISVFFSEIANSKGTVEGINLTFKILNTTVQDTGHVLGALGNTFNFIAEGMAHFTGNLEDLIGWVPIMGWLTRKINDEAESLTGNTDALHSSLTQVGGTTEQVTPGIRYFAATIAATSQAVKDYTAALMGAEKAESDANDKAQTVFETKLREKQALLTLTTTLKANGDAWDENTAKGQADVQALLNAVSADKAARDAQVAAGDGSAAAQKKADDAYNANIKSLIALAKQAGATKQELEFLQGQYLIELDAVAIVSKETATAFSKGGLIKAAHRASGGPVMPGMPYEINEQAHETVTFGQPGVVHPASLTPAWGGQRQQSAGPTYISFPSSGVALVDAIVAEMRKYIRINGGGNVQLALGS